MSVLRPNRRKDRKPDKSYMAWLHDLPCVCCFKNWFEKWNLAEGADWVREFWIDRNFQGGVIGQLSRTEAAHMGDRGLSQKCPDREAIPLCFGHHSHQGFKDSAHQLGKNFFEHHGIDRDALISELQTKFAAERKMAA